MYPKDENHGHDEKFVYLVIGYSELFLILKGSVTRCDDAENGYEEIQSEKVVFELTSFKRNKALRNMTNGEDNIQSMD